MAHSIEEQLIRNLEIISKIPRSSGDEAGISNFLLNYALTRGLEASQDDYYNLIIRKPSTLASQNLPTVILQGHLDMVYVSETNSGANYLNGITVLRNGNYLYSENSSLGADNGIAIAYFMLLMDLEKIDHPNLEMILTVQEEVGLAGAEKLDASSLNGRFMINLDAENEGVFFVSCAGGVRNDFSIRTEKTATDLSDCFEITISGLKGGHSGLEIDKQRGNAVVIMARLLNHLKNNFSLTLSELSCNGKANAIPSNCNAIVCCSDLDTVYSVVKNFERTIQSELRPHDDLSIKIEKYPLKTNEVYSNSTFESIINSLLLMPNGVYGMDRFIPGLVETSSNIGVVTSHPDFITITSSIRSNVESRKVELMDKFNKISKLTDSNCVFYNNYPGWAYNPNSKLRTLAMTCYKNMTGITPVESSLHAGLECGYFSDKIENLDIIAFGPNLHDVHTVNEKIELQSAVTIFQLLLSILEQITTI